MLPPLPSDAALFLDLDGTLVDIVARPEDVHVDEALRGQLSRLRARLDGAVAIVTGRSLADLDRLLDPLKLPAAGLHGVERRSADGSTLRMAVDTGALAAARAALSDLVARHAGLRLEDKGLAIAVHYRLARQLEATVDATIGELAATCPDELQVQRGLLVRELKPAGANKGRALRAFMAEAPFAGRIPVAIGDDLTDTDAFAAAKALGGFGVAVGSRVTASSMLPGPRAVRAWLAMLAEAAGARSPERSG
jgi:trehalose 6-phosphate phosphatase